MECINVLKYNINSWIPVGPTGTQLAIANMQNIAIATMQNIDS